MRLLTRGLVTLLMMGPADWAMAQDATPPQEIIPCEGPNMPPQCPPEAGAPRTMETARQELAVRQAAAPQPLALMQARLQFRQQLDQNQTDAVMRQLQANQPNPLLRPPNFSAAAQVVNSVVTGHPN